MIILHVLVTKLRTNVSVPIDTPIPTKPSGQKESRTLRFVNTELESMMVCATSNTVWCVKFLVGRMVVSRNDINLDMLI